MTVFYLLQWGSGEGCDYTIGCNMQISPLEAETYEHALQEAREIILGESDGESDMIALRSSDDPDYLERAVIVEHCEEIDVESWYQEIRDNYYEKEKKEIDRKEKEEYERLKKKYG